MFASLDISASALAAQRTRMDVIAGNIANANVTRQDDGTKSPYTRRFVEFMTGDGNGGDGVHVADVHLDSAPFKERYAPGHPDADAKGMLKLPNVNVSMEYIDAMEASRAYEANVAMLNMSKQMMRDSIQLFA